VKDETDAKLDRLIDALLASVAVVGKVPGGSIDVEALAVAIVAAQDAASKKPGRNILDEQVIQLQQMRDRPGGKLGYSYHVTSKITGATFTVEVQESRKSKLGRITGLLNYALPSDWKLRISQQSSEPERVYQLPDSAPEIRQPKYDTWYKPDLRFYVGALVGEQDMGTPDHRVGEDHWVALPVVWPDSPEYETVVALIAEERNSNRTA
jgi:hypothetical protein